MLTEEEKSQLQKTLQFIVTEHGEQFRKTTGIPYACHTVDVMQQVARWGIIDLGTYNVCLCHDVYEECGRHLHDCLRSLIGRNAETVVDELTFILEEGKYKDKQAYLESFVWKSVMGIVVKFADRLCNTKDFQAFDPKYALKYWNKAEPLFGALRLRKDDIEKVYGVKAYSRMIKSFNQQLDSLNFN